MSLPNIITPPPGPNGWSEFWWNNWIDHQDIQQAIQVQEKLDLEVYVIWPWQDSDTNGLLQSHQEFHDDMNAALGLNGQDLSSINFNDAEAVSAWIWEHYIEHQAAHMALGI
jgi:hypothetical protein